MEWREKFSRVVTQVYGFVDILKALEKDAEKDIQVADAIETFYVYVVQTVPELFNLIFEYDLDFGSPENIKWVKENAYDEECMAALVSIAKLVYGPFGASLVERLNALGKQASSSGTGSAKPSETQPNTKP